MRWYGGGGDDPLKCIWLVLMYFSILKGKDTVEARWGPFLSFFDLKFKGRTLLCVVLSLLLLLHFDKCLTEWQLGLGVHVKTGGK